MGIADPETKLEAISTVIDDIENLNIKEHPEKLETVLFMVQVIKNILGF